MGGRDVFVFIDGTGCDLETKTNGSLLLEEVKGEPNVKVIYQPGVGTYSDMPWFQRAFSSEIRREVSTVYRRLCDADVGKNDRVYILGYSRGAIIARMVAQMLTAPNARDSIIQKSNQLEVIAPQVCFLGLYDPVIGFPYFFPKMKYELNAVTNEKILRYVEVIAMDDQFLLFPRRSGVRQYEQVVIPGNRPSEAPALATVADTRRNQLNPTRVVEMNRHFIALPGVHGEIGGQGGDSGIRNHAFFVMLSLLSASSPRIQKILESNGNPTLWQKLAFRPICVGRESTLLDKYLLRWRRRFIGIRSIQVHPLADELCGQTGVYRNRIFGRWRKYCVPSGLHENERFGRGH